MTYYLGLDGGGTKTDCVVVDSGGRVLAQAAAGPSNPLRVGFEQAFAALAEASRKTLEKARIQAGQLSAAGAGLAGAGQPEVARRMAQFLGEIFPGAFVHAATDLEIALEAAAGPGPGVVLIAGTGSSAFGRNAAGQLARAGGHGPWVGDEGSAFDIGRRAVAAVARTRDLAASPTSLGEMIPAALGIATWEEMIERIARAPDEILPRVFPLVVEAADSGDVAAREILLSSAVQLSWLAATVIRRLSLQQQEFVLAKSGGVFGHSRLLDSQLDLLLAGAAPRAKIQTLAVSPAVGAAQLAKRLAGAQQAGGPAPAVPRSSP
jgi:N-acetylglucosamine kinase-like BadF-type ATPase